MLLCLSPPEQFTSMLLEPGNFAVLYPDDIHRPGRMIGEPRQVRKMVLKVRVLYIDVFSPLLE